MTVDRPEMATLLDRLGGAATECRDLIRQMHEAQQDLKATIREARDVIGAVHRAVEVEVSPVIAAEVHEQLEALGQMAKDHMDKTARKISSEFSALTKPMMDTLGLLDTALDLALQDEVED